MSDQAAETTGTEVARRAEPMSSANVLDKIGTISNGAMSFYSTLDQTDPAAKLAMVDAVTNSEPLADHLRETINLKDFILQATTMIDEKTGEEQPILRVILIDADGSAYHAISDGLFRSLQTYTGLLGHPSTWAEPVPVIVDEKRGRSGFRFMTIKLAPAEEKPAKK